jgi:hypothetical protein
LYSVEEVEIFYVRKQHLIGYFDDFRVRVIRMLLLRVLLHVPFPIACVHARAASVWLFARMMTTHVLNDFRTPTTTKVAPKAQEIARLLFAFISTSTTVVVVVVWLAIFQLGLFGLVHCDGRGRRR